MSLFLVLKSMPVSLLIPRFWLCSERMEPEKQRSFECLPENWTRMRDQVIFFKVFDEKRNLFFSYLYRFHSLMHVVLNGSYLNVFFSLQPTFPFWTSVTSLRRSLPSPKAPYNNCFTRKSGMPTFTHRYRKCSIWPFLTLAYRHPWLKLSFY